MKEVILPLDRINYKESEQLFDEKIDIEKLKESIKNLGIVYELIVTENNGQYYLIDGFHRYQIAKELGLQYIKCKVIENPLDATRLKIELNLYRRQISEEKQRFYELLKEKKVAEIVEKIKQSIRFEGVDVDELSHEEIIALSKLSQDEQSYVFSAVKKIYDNKYNSILAQLNEIVEEKNKQIKQLENQKVDVQKLQEMVQKKLQEKEQELKIKLLEQAKSEQAEYEREILKLKQELEALQADNEELNQNLQEMTKQIQQKEKEKQQILEEKRKLKEKEKIAEDAIKKMQDKINYFEKVEMKKILAERDALKQKVISILHTERMVEKIKNIKFDFKGFTNILFEAHGALDTKIISEIERELNEIKDLYTLAFDILKNNEVKEVEVITEG